VLLDFGATQHFGAEFVANYARISRAVIDGDRDAVAREAVRVGFAAADDSPQRIAAAVDMCLLICEPLRHAGRYDFGASNLPARVRKLGFELAIRRRLLQPPPPEALFLYRKLVGSFLLLARLGAQVDARSLIMPFLPKAG
jgi:predicted unusual protein kinase regulating ubiquinone biosynthesis (AarF/ABC1/UbiB family)